MDMVINEVHAIVVVGIYEGFLWLVICESKDNE